MSEPIVHRQVALLKVSEARVLAEIRALVPLDDFVLAVVSDTEVVVDPERIGELSARLSERGLSPLMKRATGDAGRGEPESLDTTAPRIARARTR